MEDGETASAQVLGDADLLGLILSAMDACDFDPHVLWCCPPQHSVQCNVKQVFVSRALRLRRVAVTWRRTLAAHVNAARSFDLRGLLCRTLPFDCSQATAVLLDGTPVVPPPLNRACPRLLSLSLRSSALSDAELASILRSLGGGLLRLRALFLGSCHAASESVLLALRGAPPLSLHSLDLSGCRHMTSRPMMLEGVFRSTPNLQRLDLSRIELTSSIVGSLLLVLSGSLVALALSGCSLVDDVLHCAFPLCGTRRMARLRELSLADNPRLSAAACTTVLAATPALASLDLSAADFWPSELPALLLALAASPALRWLGLHDCEAWLDADALRALDACSHLRLALSPSMLLHSSATAATLAQADAESSGCPAASRPSSPSQQVADSWEAFAIDLADACGGSSVPLLRPRTGAPAATAAAAAATSSRASATCHTAHHYLSGGTSREQTGALHQQNGRHTFRSIYHVSQGDQPLFDREDAGAGSAVRSQTDSHGLRA